MENKDQIALTFGDYLSQIGAKYKKDYQALKEYEKEKNEKKNRKRKEAGCINEVKLNTEHITKSNTEHITKSNDKVEELSVKELTEQLRRMLDVLKDTKKQ